MAGRMALRAGTLARQFGAWSGPVSSVSLLRAAVFRASARGYKERHMVQPPFCGYKVDTSRDASPLVSHPRVYSEADPGPVFSGAGVQALLRRLTGEDERQVFRRRHLPGRVPAPDYEFMTDSQLQQSREEAARTAHRLLQMPPVVAVRAGEDAAPGPALCHDPALAPLECDMVFTDISKGVPDSKRLIVVREKDGTLRHASYEQRHRCNQIYNPRTGRKHRHPDMFREESFKAALENSYYERLLDRATVQLEPDDNLYQSVCAGVYDHINDKSAFQKLRSTRHFGPMTFFLAWHKNIDKLVVFFLEELSDLSRASDVVEVFAFAHPGSATARFIQENKPGDTNDDSAIFCMGVLESFLNNECVNRPLLDLSIKNYKEAARARSESERRLSAVAM